MITWAERFEAVKAFALFLLVAVVPPIVLAVA